MAPSKSILELNFSIFCDLYQIIGLPNLIYLANFYKTQKTFPYVYFIVFCLAHIGLILLYQFVNLLERFGGHIFYPNLLLD